MTEPTPQNGKKHISYWMVAIIVTAVSGAFGTVEYIRRPFVAAQENQAEDHDKIIRLEAQYEGIMQSLGKNTESLDRIEKELGTK